jgi:2-amino-4-hydroxy-6-hydroxymethyldihydropteridine diphosphokinase
VLTSLNPIELLKQIKDIEKKLGRDKSVSNLYKDRIIDIDIIFYGNQVVITDFLKIPHILYRKRKFVILPMLEIVPEKIDPVDGKKIFQILQECEDFSIVKKF